MDRPKFRAEAAPLLFQAGGATVAAKPREWNGGLLGWGGSEVVYLQIGDEWVRATAQMLIRIEGSKSWAE